MVRYSVTRGVGFLFKINIMKTFIYQHNVSFEIKEIKADSLESANIKLELEVEDYQAWSNIGAI